LQDCRIAGLQDCRIAGLQDCRIIFAQYYRDCNHLSISASQHLSISASQHLSISASQHLSISASQDYKFPLSLQLLKRFHPNALGIMGLWDYGIMGLWDYFLRFLLRLPAQNLQCHIRSIPKRRSKSVYPQNINTVMMHEARSATQKPHR